MGDVILFTLLGIGGCPFYFFSVRTGFIICSILCLLLFGYNIVLKMMRAISIAFMAACAVVAIMLTRNVWNTVLLTASLYYALAWVIPLLLSVIPEVVLLMIVGLVGLVFGLCGNLWVLFPCGAFCLTCLMSSMLQGKVRPYVYSIIAAVLVLVSLFVYIHPEPDGTYVKIAKVFCYSACLTYPLVSLYILLNRLIKGSFDEPKNQ